MRVMRACVTANAIVLGLTLAGLAFAACSSGGTNPSPPPSAPDVPASPDAPKPAATETPAPVGPAPAGPPRSMITNEPPDGGVVLNNAMTSGDAGGADRFTAMVDVIKANRDDFRRCFDLWSAKNPGVNGKVVGVWNLKPDGVLDKFDVDVAKSTVSPPELVACMTGVAKKITYPKSPVGKETRFTYPFDFKAHN